MYQSKSFIKVISTFALICLLNAGCSDFLDVVPDGTGKLENVFTSRETTLRYLYSCYSFLQRVDPLQGLEVTGCGELWTFREPQYQVVNTDGIKIADGLQSPFVNLYNRWHHFFAGINNCNTLIAGLQEYEVPYLPDWERELWIAETKVLKAWFHFYLLRMYGPIPVIRENLPISTSVEDVQVPRESVDVAFDYMVQLLDEAIPYLMPNAATTDDYGRIDKAIALSMKAQVLVTAASPLFNCNEEQAPLKNKDGLQLFPQNQDQELAKWSKAEEACEAALDFCINTRGMKLYEYPGHTNYDLTPTIMQQMTLRQAFCERWSSEVIWAYTNAWVSDLQYRSAKSIGTYVWVQNYAVFGVPLSIVEQFYSGNGVPITEDRDWNYDTRYNLRIAQSSENLYIREGETTVRLNFDREPRFYAWLVFDRAVFYGWGFEDDSNPANLLYYQTRRFEPQSVQDPFSINGTAGPITGYLPKKYIHYKTQGRAEQQASIENYIWPLMRLPELMLYYAEAVNEANNTPEARGKAMNYLDIIRARAGLKSVSESWTTHSKTPDKFRSQNGLREIIRQERTIELAFEGQRYWDLRRWKTAPEILNAPVLGWDMTQREPAYYYKPYTISEQTFGLKDYFSPIPDAELIRNLKLVQNLGWN